MTQNQRRAEQAIAKFKKNYGEKSAYLGPRPRSTGITPTGLVSLDCNLGTGGYVDGCFYEIFGPPDIGKSSGLGAAALRQAQERGRLCGLIATEPGTSEEFLEDNDLDPSSIVYLEPDNAEEAFDMFFDMVYDHSVDFILFDSLGALSKKKANESGAASQVGGASKIVTEGFTRTAVRASKSEITAVFINQVRDKIGAKVPTVHPPGGHAREHLCPVRIQMRPGKNKHQGTVDGERITFGREVIVKIVRNKLAKGSEQVVHADYYQKEYEKDGHFHPVGFDVAQDAFNFGRTLGLIKKDGSWYESKHFAKLQGEKAVIELLGNRPSIVDKIRSDALDMVWAREAEARKKAKEKRQQAKKEK